jgi:hypothetical protein
MGDGTVGNARRIVGVRSLLLIILTTAGASSAKEVFSGDFAGAGGEYEFEISTYMDWVVVSFDVPGDASFRVAVYGQEEGELGDFDLSTCGVIKLIGGGRFRLRVYSAAGGGRWSASWTEAWRPEKFEFPFGKKQVVETTPDR